jgi:curli biogenesis system outer membrane secretion channel CsgG
MPRPTAQQNRPPRVSPAEATHLTRKEATVAHITSRIDRPAGLLLTALTLVVAQGGAWAATPVLSPESPAPSEWKAIFVNERGVTTPVVEPIGRYHDKDWLSLRFAEYHGPKIRLALMKVENKSAAAEQAAAAGTVAPTPKLAQVQVANLLDLLTTATINTNRFQLVERKEIESVLSEQDLGASGRAQKGTSPKTGQMQGAQYMLYASVNDWTPDKSHRSAGGGSGRPSILNILNVDKSVAEVAMSFRMLDASSGKILFSTTERATVESWGVGFGGFQHGSGGGGSVKDTSPISNAVQACINKGIYRLAMWVKDRPWRGRVVKVAGSRVYISAGGDDGITQGLVLDALAHGEELIDPATGTSLGRTLERVGTVQVAEVENNYAIATIVDGCQKLKAGDEVEIRISR